MRLIGAWIVGIVAVVGLSWALVANDYALFSTFAPKYEQTRRTTFEQSKAYRQGMVQELQNMQFEYLKATPEQQDALASVILHRSADVPADAMPPDLARFVGELRRAR